MLIFLITIIGFLLRTYKLNPVPTGFFVINPIDYNSNQKQILAVDPNRVGEIPANLTLDIKKTIYYPNSLPAFYIGELRSK